MNQQQHKHRLRTLRGAYINFTGQIFALDYAAVKTIKNVKLAWRLPYLSNVSSRGNNQIITVMKQRKWL